MKLIATMIQRLPPSSPVWEACRLLHDILCRKGQLGHMRYRNIFLGRYNAVYFPIPKVACSSLKVLCARNLSLPLDGAAHLDDTIHEVNFPYLTPHELRADHSSYCRFCFVRNPWDRLLSCYSDKVDAAELAANFERYGVFRPRMPFHDFVEQVCRVPDAIADGHFRSQSSFVTDRDGRLMVDFVGKLESLCEDLKRLSEQTCLNVEFVPHLRKTAKRAYQERYCRRTRDLVARKYHRDVELFDYDF